MGRLPPPIEDGSKQVMMGDKDGEGKVFVRFDMD